MLPINTQDGRFHDGNGSTIVGTIVTADFQTGVQDEILNTVKAAGFEPSAENNQLQKAIMKLIDLKAVDAYTKTESDGRYEKKGYAYSKEELEELLAKSSFSTGSLVMHFGQTPPSGTLVCDGGAISRKAYANLFAAIGTKYGIGDGSTTFNLPKFVSGEAAVSGDITEIAEITTGDVKKHKHTLGFTIYGYEGNGPRMHILNDSQYYKNTTEAGGDRNLAAGVKVLYCIKY